jgi:hypothetical protein
MSRCDLSGSNLTLDIPGNPPLSWPTVAESNWLTKQANNALYRCMTTGSARNKGVRKTPGLAEPTRLVAS